MARLLEPTEAISRNHKPLAVFETRFVTSEHHDVMPDGTQTLGEILDVMLQSRAQEHGRKVLSITLHMAEEQL